jgi:hypothetical protein
MELGLNGVQIRENVCVIVFKIVQNHGAWPVVNELGASIEVAGVVFVCFRNEERRFT